MMYKPINFIFLISIITFFSCNDINLKELSSESSKLFNSGKYKECINLTDNIDASKLNIQILENKAWSYVHINKWDSATIMFKSIYNIDSTDRIALLGLSHINTDNNEKIKFGYKYLKEDIDSSQIALTYQHIADAHKGLKNYNKTIKAFNLSIDYLGNDINKNEAFVYYKKSLTQYILKDYEGAITSLNLYLEKNPGNKTGTGLLKEIQELQKE